MGCSASTSKNISLPVVDASSAAPRLQHSKSSKRRFTVLLIVQGLILAHIAHWLIVRGRGGKTLAPIEPSESIQTVTDGVITVGAIFFVLALFSTMILGRWFCGWGCHVVLLQDWCSILLKKVGLRPKPFRARLLMLVPLLLGLYMFVWPLAYRFGLVPLVGWMESSLGAEHGLTTSLRGFFGFFNVPLPSSVPPLRGEWHLSEDEFWKTFPGWVVGVPFLLICGFATVYFLGAKGYCTYGCPYGGMFAPLDKYAFGRIRVNDDCEHCGHCTAVCTSNVRVHEEVAEFGMVVDPGCMKCLDCVSVCPNDALSFGLGKPGLLKGKPKTTGVKPNWDLSWPEEIAMFVIFALCFYGSRGVYGSGVLPLLFASGVAACSTFIIWRAWRILRQKNVNFHRWRLKYRGSIQKPGMLFLAGAIIIGLFGVQSVAVKSLRFAGDKYDRKVTIPRQAVLTTNPQPLPDDMSVYADRARRLYTLSSSLRRGGIGLMDDPSTSLRLAWLHACEQEYDIAEDHVRRAIEIVGPTDSLVGNSNMSCSPSKLARSHNGSSGGMTIALW
ncbi:MAG: 4Fe-4S binding protein [Planctomycetota bacterium]